MKKAKDKKIGKKGKKDKDKKDKKKGDKKKDKEGKDKKKGSKHLILESDDDEDTVAKLDKKKKKDKTDKKEKDKKGKKDKDKKDKKAKGGKKGASNKSSGSEEAIDSLNDRMPNSSHRNNNGKMSREQMMKIVEEEKLNMVLPEDAYILYENAIKMEEDVEIQNIFKHFVKIKNSSYLIESAMSRSEEMILTFSEENFSNPEGGIFFKLRSQRNLQYREAFL